MKKIIAGLGIGIILIITPFSCEKTTVEDKPNTIKLALKSAEIIESDQLFAFELFHQVCSLSIEENIMISPLSVSYALGMTYNGASGSTLDAFNKVLHFDSLTRAEVNESYKDLMHQLITLDDDVEFSIANSIWYKEGSNVLAEFIARNQEYFDAAIEELNFSDPDAVNTINKWIENKTNDKIKDMLDFIPADAYMYLVNAIYFNATWMYEFNPNDTYSGSFAMENGGSKEVEYMKTEGAFYYSNTEEYTAVELPYGDSTFSMVAMLPSGDNTAMDLIGLIDYDTWNVRSQFSSTQNVQIEIPKFSYEFKDLLNIPLTKLGLGVAFSSAADFSDITRETELYISRVIHQTFIEVKEEGTEAAAATIVEMRYNSVETPPSILFNKPFLYIIKENSTGAIMFMGKVGNP